MEEFVSNKDFEFKFNQLLKDSLEVAVKLINQSSIRSLKNEKEIQRKYFSKLYLDGFASLRKELDDKPLINMNPEGDHRWSGKITSEKDFEGIAEFVIRARNNLFHGDKNLDEKRDMFIVTNGNILLEPLVDTILELMSIEMEKPKVR